MFFTLECNVEVSGVGLCFSLNELNSALLQEYLYLEYLY